MNRPGVKVGLKLFTPVDTAGSEWRSTLIDDNTMACEDLKAADAIVDEAARKAAYEELNKQIAQEYIPGLPISHSPPALVVSSKVQGLVASPLTAEMFDQVTVSSK